VFFICQKYVLFDTVVIEDNLIRLSKELRDGTYRPGRSMCFIINDPVKREVFAASFRDRVVHHLLYVCHTENARQVAFLRGCVVKPDVLDGIAQMANLRKDSVEPDRLRCWRPD